jgi:serine/threonine protein kinase/Tfp pilus assembly protein PilF
MTIKCPKCDTENPSDSKYCKECAAPLQPSEEISAPTETLEAAKEELTTGSTFAGRYQIIEELGKGGMGKVYKANDTKINEKIALKLIKPEVAADKKTIERFSNELKFARKIRHKNVCQMFDLNEEKGTHYITMEYVKGEDLKKLIRKMGQLSVGQVIPIAKQVCDGLAEAHRLGVVHRDLKPQNIMVDEEGNARIMDFGIARSILGKGITGAGVMIGTPEYMSPEQAEVKEVEQRSDIYSLGVILYEMVTGRVPFEGETPLGIAMKHKSEIPKDPRELNTQIPEDLSRVILRCMEKDKEKRYQSVEEVRSELKNIEKGIPTTERIVPKRKPITSKEITVTFGLKKLFIPALVIVALVIAAVIIWQVFPRKEAIPTPSGKPSIAVLPFEDLSPQKDQGYLCDGFAESLISSLTKIKDLRVPARTSSFSFKEKERDIQEIGEKLNVKTILEGSVQKAGDRLRITTQLINVDDESLIWSEQYNRELDDVFAIQDEITLAIVDKLKLNLLGEEKASLVKRYTENLEAYNLYLQGRFFWNKRTDEGAKKAIEYFEQSIEKDPSYALAYTGLADSYLLLPYYFTISPKEVYPKAKEAAQKALEIDNTLSEAHTSMAMIKLTYDWDWVGAEKEFKRAIELNPSYATAHHWYAWFLMWMARFNEAMEEIERARDLDPLSLIINRDIGTVSLLARQYDQAIEILQKMLEMSPNFPQTRIYLARAYFLKSMYKKALSVLQKEKELIGLYPLLESWIGICYMKMGQKTKTQEVLDQLIQRSEQEYVSSYFIALIYFAIGENDQGFKRLDQAYNERSGFLCYLKTEPILDNLRSDPRFQDLMQRMNFPE